MRPVLLVLLPVSMSLGCMCLPNPQSEWTTSEGGEQRSTLQDPTIQAAATFPPALDVDVDWGSSTPEHGERRERAHVAHSGFRGDGHRH